MGEGGSSPKENGYKIHPKTILAALRDLKGRDPRRRGKLFSPRWAGWSDGGRQLGQGWRRLVRTTLRKAWVTLASGEDLLIDTTTWYAVANRSSRATRDRLAKRTELQAITETDIRYSSWRYGPKLELRAKAFGCMEFCFVCWGFLE